MPERLELPILAASLLPSQSQHGFRSQRRTVTALLQLVTKIARGFNEPKPATLTWLLSLDLKKAFYMIDHHKLLKKVAESDLHPNLKRWLVAYMRDRKIKVLYQGVSSR